MKINREAAMEKCTTIDEYLKQFDGDVLERMKKMRELIRGCSPEITEKIAWGMPTFVLNGNLVHFSGEKRHMGFHPSNTGIEAFAERIEAAGYKHSKGTMQLPYDKPMPYDLIREIVMFRVEEQKRKGK